MRQLSQLGIRGCLHPAKPDARSIRAIDVGTIQKEHVRINIEIEGTSKALDQRDCATAVRRARKPRLLDQVRGK